MTHTETTNQFEPEYIQVSPQSEVYQNIINKGWDQLDIFMQMFNTLQEKKNLKNGTAGEVTLFE